MSTERIDPEVIEVAERAWIAAPPSTPRDAFQLRGAMEAAIRAVDEKCCELVDPEGQEYVYRVVWEERDGSRGNTNALLDLEAARAASGLGRNTDGWTIWVERALLGDWKRV